ncbi:competence protein ComE, partial [Cylindrospermopsis raciborskii LB2897]|nr:competence protein ComE [Cylindrospermopsis raciborskii LB2897]
MSIPSKLKNSFYILLFFSTISGCQKTLSPRQLLPPLPQDPLIQVYFNHAQSSEYQESYR